MALWRLLLACSFNALTAHNWVNQVQVHQVLNHFTLLHCVPTGNLWSRDSRANCVKNRLRKSYWLRVQSSTNFSLTAFPPMSSCEFVSTHRFPFCFSFIFMCSRILTVLLNTLVLWLCFTSRLDFDGSIIEASGWSNQTRNCSNCRWICMLMQALDAYLLLIILFPPFSNHVSLHVSCRIAWTQDHRMHKGSKAVFHLEAFAARFMAIYKRWVRLCYVASIVMIVLFLCWYVLIAIALYSCFRSLTVPNTSLLTHSAEPFESWWADSFSSSFISIWTYAFRWIQRS